MSFKVAINGFGRIGRIVFRAAMKEKGFKIVAINDLTDAKTLAHLLKYDSVHGIFPYHVEHTDNSIIINGHEIRILTEKDPSALPWKKKNIDVVLESTGRFTSRDKAELHLKGGAKRVIISAPATDEDITIVMGVNSDKYDPQKHFVISNASCTTNCLAPVAKVLDREFGIEKGLITTVHSYTNDQQILDLPHKDLRRARAAAVSMIPTTTGAAKAVSLVLPQLKGKLDGMAIRVPTPNVSLVDLVCMLNKKTDAAAINEAFKAAAENELKGILGYSTEPLVSVDYNDCLNSSTVDGLSTKVLDGNMAKVLAWYDNESGFSKRVIDLINLIASKN